MTITFDGETLETNLLRLRPHFIKLGDFVLYQGSLMKVITIQRDCPSISSHRKVFTMFTLQTREGKVVPVPDLHGFVNIHRTKKGTYRAHLGQRTV